METSCIAVSPRFLRKVKIGYHRHHHHHPRELVINLNLPLLHFKVIIVLLCLTFSVLHILLLVSEPTQPRMFVNIPDNGQMELEIYLVWFGFEQFGFTCDSI